MCYECACGSTTTIMSDDSITQETFERAAEGAGISVEEAMRNTLELLQTELAQRDRDRAPKGAAPRK